MSKQHPQPGIARHLRVWLGFVILSLCFGSCGGVAVAAAPSTNTAALNDLRTQLRSRQTEAQAELNLALSFQNGTTNLPPASTPGEALQYRLTLELLVRSYQQGLDELDTLDKAKTNPRGSEAEIREWTGFGEPPPYPIQTVDALRDAIDSLSATIAASETTLSVVQIFGAEGRANLEASDERLRLVTEQIENTRDAAQITRLNWERTLEQTRNRQAMSSITLFDLRRQTLELELTVRRRELAPLQRQLASAHQQVRFSQADLQIVLKGLEAEREALDLDYRQAETAKSTSQSELDSARKDLATLLKGGAETQSAVPRNAELRALEDRVQLCAAQADTAEQRLLVLRQLQDLNLHERSLWESRFTIFDSKDLPQLQRGYRGLKRLTVLIQAAKPHFTKQVQLAGSLVTEQQRRLRASSASPEQSSLALALAETYRQREEVAFRGLRGLQRLERQALRWKESLDEERQALPLGGRIRDLFTSFSSLGRKLWEFELFAAQDTIVVDGQSITGRRSVTVAKVVKALLILAGGYALALMLSRLLERLAVQHLKVDRNQAKLLRQWLRVVFIILLACLSLMLVKIPLTVFAFLGGALAIGFGFGTQNLLKNFISGIIILFERPFRVGDVLDVGNRRGTVTSIGIRSSVLNLFDGTEILIPNSALLENQLTNWTYSSNRVRFALALGVAYGTNTRKVAQCLTEIVARHGLVQKEPSPQVLFQDFGDSSLQFELRYWVDVREHNSSQIGSDLRHMIAVTFADQGLVLAFPQRDVHLDSVRPLQVQVIPPPTSPPPPPPQNSSSS